LEKRSDRLVELLQTEEPRVVGLIEHKLQECNVADVQTKLQSVAPDYAAHFTCSTAKKGYSGVALLCRTSAPPERVTFGLPGGAASDVALTEGRIATAEYGDAIVVVVYSPNSGQALERLQYRVDTWDPGLLAYVQSLTSSGKPVLVLGDLNAAHLDRDIWNVEAKHIPKSAGTTPEERTSFGKFLDAGLVDTLRVQHPDAKAVFSYWSVRAKGRPMNRGLRLAIASAPRPRLRSSWMPSCFRRLRRTVIMRLSAPRSHSEPDGRGRDHSPHCRELESSPRRASYGRLRPHTNGLSTIRKQAGQFFKQSSDWRCLARSP